MPLTSYYLSLFCLLSYLMVAMFRFPQGCSPTQSLKGQPCLLMVVSFPLGMKAGARPGGTPGAPAGQPGAEGESVLSKILPGGAAEQAGKLTEGRHCPQPAPSWIAAPGPSCGQGWVWAMIPGSASQPQASLKVYLPLPSGSLVVGGVGCPCPLCWTGLHGAKRPQLGGTLVRFPDASLLFLCHSCLCFWQKVLLILVTMPCRVSICCLDRASLHVGVLREPLGGVWSPAVGDVARGAVSSPG